jgi:hypothetical protein
MGSDIKKGNLRVAFFLREKQESAVVTISSGREDDYVRLELA